MLDWTNVELNTRIKIRIINNKKKFQSLEDVLLYTKEDLQKITMLPLEDVNNLLLTLSTHIYKGFYDPLMIQNRYLKTYLKNIDELLGGGISNHGITEISGASGAGKTQFVLHLCAQQLYNFVTSHEKNCIIYISTENAFPIKRFEQIVQNLSQDVNLQNIIMNRILLDHIGDLKCLWFSLKNKINLLQNQQQKILLIAIDSLTSIFRGNDLATAHKKFHKGNKSWNSHKTGSFCNQNDQVKEVASYLHKLSIDHGIAIICVNQVTDFFNIDEGSPLAQHYSGLGYLKPMQCKITDKPEFFDDCIYTHNVNKVPCLGLTWARFVTHRLFISKVNEVDTINDKGRDPSLLTPKPSIEIGQKRLLHNLWSPSTTTPKTGAFYITPNGLSSPPL